MNIENYKGDWCLVTGATSGIGLEFCKQLAIAGINLIMVARREDVLKDISKTLSNLHNIKILIIVADLSSLDSPQLIYETTKAKGICIRILINNAGIGHWGPFENSSLHKYYEMININVTSVVALTHLYLPDLASYTHSTIINISSPASYQPVSYMAVYAATKSFIHNFSQALYGELAEKNIYVQTLVPGPTSTEFDKKAGAYQSILSKRDPTELVVKKSLANICSTDPIIKVAKGTYKQSLFSGLFPSKMVINEVKKMFKPPL